MYLDSRKGPIYRRVIARLITTPQAKVGKNGAIRY